MRIYANFIKTHFPKTKKGWFDYLFYSEIEARIVEAIIHLPVFFYTVYVGLHLAIALIYFSEPPGGYKASYVFSNSMSPSIKPGSVVILAPAERVKLGDIVSFKEIDPNTHNHTGRRIIHRIVEIEDFGGKVGIVTQGDNNPFPDPGFLDPQDIEGKLLFVIPFFGYISYVSTKWWGFLLFIVVPGFLIIRSEIINIGRMRRLSKLNKSQRV
jgi:signal peptidase